MIEDFDRLISSINKISLSEFTGDQIYETMIIHYCFNLF